MITFGDRFRIFDIKDKNNLNKQTDNNNKMVYHKFGELIEEVQEIRHIKRDGPHYIYEYDPNVHVSSEEGLTLPQQYRKIGQLPPTHFDWIIPPQHHHL
jgi:predicted transcriptional regulator